MSESNVSHGVDEIQYPAGHGLGGIKETPRYVQPAEGKVSETALARVTATNQGLAQAGVTWSEKAVYALGTRAFQEVTSRRLCEERQAVEQMPETLGALESLRDLGIKQDRSTLRTNLERICSTSDGALIYSSSHPDVAALSATEEALAHLGGFYGARGLSTYLPVAPLGIRAHIISQVARDILDEKNAAREEGEEPKDREVVMASRLDLKGDRSYYRVASTRYQPFEVLDFARAILDSDEARTALAGSRCKVIYDGRRCKLDFVWNTDETLYRAEGDFATGDVFRVAQRMILDEVRAEATIHQSVAWRNACMNMAIIQEAKGTRKSWRHIHRTEGKTGLIAQLVERVTNHRQAMAGFLDQWDGARLNRILDSFDGNPVPVFQALVASNLVKLPGRDAELNVKRLVASWEREPGPTLADITNAVTRVAHEGNWWYSYEQAEEAEVSGSNLIYAKNIRAKIQNGLELWAEKFQDAPQEVAATA